MGVEFREEARALLEEEELPLLPRWAAVVFAARCLRRALPLITRACPGRYHWVAIEEQLEDAERSAAQAAPVKLPSVPGLRRSLSRSERIASDVEWDGDILFALERAASFVGASQQLPQRYPGLAFSGVAEALVAVLAYVRRRSPQVRERVGRAFLEGIRRDHAQVFTHLDGVNGDDETPLTPEVFGPMWPDGPPSGWPPEDPWWRDWRLRDGR